MSVARSTTATRSITVGDKVEINILNDGEDPVVMADAEYPDFIWSLGVRPVVRALGCAGDHPLPTTCALVSPTHPLASPRVFAARLLQETRPTIDDYLEMGEDNVRAAVPYRAQHRSIASAL